MGGLHLPGWEEVAAMTEAQKVLRTNALEKLQWAVQDVPGTTGSLAIDNVHLVGATAVTGVAHDEFSAQKLINQMDISKGRGSIRISLPTQIQSVNYTEVQILNAAGKAIAVHKASAFDNSVSFETDRFSNGVYFVRLNMVKKDGKVQSVKKAFTHMD